MIDIVKQTLEFYFENSKAPQIEDIEVNDSLLLEKTWSTFVTLYVSWIIKWSSGNIKEIEDNLVLEIISNTISALEDSRFPNIEIKDKDNIKIRVDEISNRGKPLNDWEIENIDPTKFWVLVIKTDYEKSATILPNISGSLMTWKDFSPIFSKKLDEDFDDKNYLVYKIETNISTNL